jgi:hypothetical protein
MTAAWIASDVRATAMSHRILGRAATQALAAQGSVRSALTSLANSPYGHDIRADQSLEAAQHAVATAVLWNTRVLAGWVPAAGTPMMRVLVGWYEIANIDAQLRSDFGVPAHPYFRLGGLAIGWSRLGGASSVADLCDRLATTAWGRPDDETARTIGLTLRATLLQDAAAKLPGCRDWITSAAALLLARERTRGQAPLPARPARVFASLLGGQVLTAPNFEELLAVLPDTARWAFDGVTTDKDLWRAESRWWSGVEAAGMAHVRGARFGPMPVIGTVALLAADAWRVRAALTAAANGAKGLEEFDALS